MLTKPIENLPINTTINLCCDRCGSMFDRTIKYMKQSRKRHNHQDYCLNCSRTIGASKRPQNNKEFLDSYRDSPAYYEGVKNRPTITGINNPMWGKCFSPESKEKRSIIWKSKTGEHARNWKGGKSSLNNRVKSMLQRRHKWFHRVIDRDNQTCQQCGARKQLDAHHIKPIKTIITELLQNTNILTESNKIIWLLNQPEIIDEQLTNGITLCRTCHKQIHQNWGSHEPKIQK